VIARLLSKETLAGTSLNVASVVEEQGPLAVASFFPLATLMQPRQTAWVDRRQYSILSAPGGVTLSLISSSRPPSKRSCSMLRGDGNV